MVRRDRRAAVGEPFEQREVDDPQIVQAVVVHGGPTELEAEQPEHVPHRWTAVGHDQDEIAAVGVHRVDDRELVRLRTGTWRPAT